MRALVVDDVPAMRQFLKLVLAGMKDVQADEARDGMEALKLWSAQRYDLLLLDINLPLLDGIKLLSTIRSTERVERGVPVIVISTVTDEPTMNRVQELGATHVLPKPVQAFQVADAVREALRLPVGASPSYERRQVRRLHVPVSVRWKGDEIIETSTWDISPTGAFIISARVLPLQTRASLVLHLPASVIELECEVMHVRPKTVVLLPSGFGVRFINATPDQEAKLAALFVSPG